MLYTWTPSATDTSSLARSLVHHKSTYFFTCTVFGPPRVYFISGTTICSTLQHALSFLLPKTICKKHPPQKETENRDGNAAMCRCLAHHKNERFARVAFDQVISGLGPQHPAHGVTGFSRPSTPRVVQNLPPVHKVPPRNTGFYGAPALRVLDCFGSQVFMRAAVCPAICSTHECPTTPASSPPRTWILGARIQ